ncbi:MAG: Rpn family recombination-promoting nuclease/putative transposase [Treponema sp.]|jgi:predicted transposase/invertase (TIGR01784 family)|nr:Rpn family recombination-promoting nuclease/putative transposase [Treponema sp.]
MKPIEELTFTDDYMFGEIMKIEEICKGVIERLLHIQIEKIEYITLQKEISPFYETRGVRFDVFVKDSDKVYDIEMQNRKYADIEKRTRYYQAMIDMDMLAKGASFRELKDSLIIFICKTDLFDLGEPCYKTKTIFENYPDRIFDDRTQKLFYNASAYKKETDEELYKFLQFISTNKPESEFTKEIFERVETTKINEKFRSDYMRCNIRDFDIREEGKTEGITIGEAKGRRDAKLEAAKNLIDLGVSLDIISKAQDLPLETVQQLADDILPTHL